MNSQVFHLAQANFARGRGPVDSPVMAGFVALLAYINSVADRSPGFVWRLQTEDGDSTAIRAFDDPLIIFNMSVGESMEALHDHVYTSDHLEPLQKRRDWFEKVDAPSLVLWWIPAGHTPTVGDALERLEILKKVGPCPQAFTFRKHFAAPGQHTSSERRTFSGCDS